MRRSKLLGGFVLGGFVLGAAIAQVTSYSWSDWKLTRTIEIEAPTFHVQGIDFDADSFWITSVDSASRKGYLQEFDWNSGVQRRRVEIQDGDRFHPGGFGSDT